MSHDEWTNEEIPSGFDSLRGILCEPTIGTGVFDVTVTGSGQVEVYTKAESKDELEFFSNLPVFLDAYQRAFIDAAERSSKSAVLEKTYDWPSLLMSRLHKKLSPQTSIRDVAIQSEYMRQTYSRVFALWFSIYHENFLTKADSPTNITVKAEIKQLRMVSSIPFMVTTLVLLVSYIPAVIIVYVKRRNAFPGPRMPKSFGAIIPWIAHSRMLEDFKGTGHMTTRQINGYLTTPNRKYKFG